MGTIGATVSSEAADAVIVVAASIASPTQSGSADGRCRSRRGWDSAAPRWDLPPLV
jgi:hypothetical protein